MKKLVIIAAIATLCSCAPQRTPQGSIAGVTIYSPSTNNLMVEIQNELLAGGHPTGAYEVNGKVKFIYEE